MRQKLRQEIRSLADDIALEAARKCTVELTYSQLRSLMCVRCCGSMLAIRLFYGPEALETLACLVEQPEDTMKVLNWLQGCLADRESSGTQTGIVRSFLATHSGLVKHNGQLKAEEEFETKEGQLTKQARELLAKRRFKLVPIHKVEDGELAEVLTRISKRIITTAVVTKARQSLCGETARQIAKLSRGTTKKFRQILSSKRKK